MWLRAVPAILGIILLIGELTVALAAGYGSQPAEEPGQVDEELQSEIEGYLYDLSGTYGVAIRDPATGRTVLVNADQPFLAGSTYKLLVMYRVYQQLGNGDLSLDEGVPILAGDADQDEPYAWLVPGDWVTVADALEAMITASNNASAFALVRRVGGWGVVESAAAEIGMSNTWLEGEYFWTTPSDMQTFLESLAKGDLVSAEASASMTELLKRQQINYMIPALLPEEASAAHKTGSLPGVENDVGIVYGPAGSYILSVLTDNANEGEAIDVISQIALKAYERYAAGPAPDLHSPATEEQSSDGT